MREAKILAAVKQAKDAVHDEALTRLRVERLERRAANLEEWAEAFTSLSLWRRVRWLVTGR